MSNLKDEKTTILVLGASGMLGHKMFEVFSKANNYSVFGTVTAKNSFKGLLPEKYIPQIIDDVYADKINTVRHVISEIKPDVVVNCIGIIKQNEKSRNIENMIALNALFPQQLASTCDKLECKLITIATDCVFDGRKGMAYSESDQPTCHDAYGMTKYLGEINEGGHLTLRTSIIGHELHTHKSLVDWFLHEKNNTVKGYTKAIFSGFPTVVLARIISEKILPKPEMKGLYHISADPISKYDLLAKIAEIYGKKVDIIPDEALNINRSLDSTRLRAELDYTPPSWDELLQEMHRDYKLSPFYQSTQ